MAVHTTLFLEKVRHAIFVCVDRRVGMGGVQRGRSMLPHVHTHTPPTNNSPPSPPPPPPQPQRPAQVLDACVDWRELVEPRAHALFEKQQKEAHLEHPGFKGAKPLLAPKGTYAGMSICV